jgi:rhodanese-related sulfurtransferase
MASDAKKVSVEDAREEVARGEAVAVDVRSKEEWSKGHVPGAIHFAEGGEASDRTKRLEDGARLMVIARNGKLAVRAAKDLSARGYDAVAVDGGMDDWASSFNTQPTEDPAGDTELGAG